MKYTTFDIEASNWTNFELLGSYDGTDYTLYRSIPAYLSEVLDFNKYNGYTHYAHYAGRYDFKFLLPYLVEVDARIEIIDVGGKIIEMKLKKGKKIIRFRDSYAILPKAQKELAEMFDVKHLKKDIDFTKIKNWQTDKGLLKRLEHDCKGLYEIIEKYRQWVGTKNLSMTLASQALKKWKGDFYKTKDLTFLKPPQEKFIREGYYGGRVEIFKMTGRDLYYYDINSLYPSVMIEDMPTGLPIKTNKYHPDKIGFYRIKVFNYKVDIPYLPYRPDIKLLFPNGTFTTNVTSAEIQELIKDKVKFEIKEGLVFSGKSKVFEPYINHYYTIKETADRDCSLFYISKLYLNSLYGKLGQRRERQIIIKPDTFEELKDLTPYYEEYNLYLKECYNKHGFILPYLSSYTTSKARMKLYRLLKKAGPSAIYYCDTDSLVTTKKFTVDNKLGGLKLEYPKIDEAVFLLPKTYALKIDKKTIIKIKGFQEQGFKFTDFKKALTSKDNTSLSSTYNKILGFKENLRSFNSLNITRQEQTKSIRHIYNKREIIENYNTIPLTIKDI